MDIWELRSKKILMGLNKTPVAVIEAIEQKDDEDILWLLSKEDCEYIKEHYEFVVKDGALHIEKKKPIAFGEINWNTFRYTPYRNNYNILWETPDPLR